MTIGSSYSEPIANKFQNSDWTGQLNFDGPIFQNFRGTNNALISSWMVDDQLIAPFNPNHSLHNREPPKSIKLNATQPLESVLPWTSSIKSIETGHDWFCMKPRSFNQIQFIRGYQHINQNDRHENIKTLKKERRMRRRKKKTERNSKIEFVKKYKKRGGGDDECLRLGKRQQSGVIEDTTDARQLHGTDLAPLASFRWWQLVPDCYNPTAVLTSISTSYWLDRFNSIGFFGIYQSSPHRKSFETIFIQFRSSMLNSSSSSRSNSIILEHSFQSSSWLARWNDANV